MFAKLLKHDFRASWGLLGILSLIALGAGAAGSGLVRYFDHAVNGDIWAAMGVLAMMAVVFYLIAYSIAAMFILLGRFYKSRFTDEGYLTFTLPVTTHQVLLSSFLNCFLGLLLAMAVTVASFGIFVFFGIASLDGERMEFIRLCFERLPDAVHALGGLGTILMFLLMAVVSIASEVVTIMLAITIGSVLAKKHKVLTAIGAYYGLHVLLSIISIAAPITLRGTSVIQWFSQGSAAAFFGACAGYGAVIGLACYFAMYYLTHKKLNLN